MPAVSEKQRRFFGAVMGAKKHQPGASGKAKEVAKSMPESSIKDFLRKKSAYAAGFVDKCAAAGVDAEALIKMAAADANVTNSATSTNMPFALNPEGPTRQHAKEAPGKIKIGPRMTRQQFNMRNQGK